MDKQMPTQEQIKEFWEWCGKHTYWTYEKGWNNYPSINLNDLFKYAVPKVVSGDLHLEIYITDEDTAVTIKRAGDTVSFRCLEDPALALFWALWQIKENK